MNETENGLTMDTCASPDAQDFTKSESTGENEKGITKRMSDRINEIRKNEVEPLLQKISELEQTKSSLAEKEQREIEYLRKRDFERTKEEVLDSLKKEFPQDNIKDIDHFDSRFYAMLKVGIDAPSAYRAIVMQSRAKTLPTSGSAQGAAVQDGFYSEERVRTMSAKEIKNNYDKVIASMKKWKKS